MGVGGGGVKDAEVVSPGTSVPGTGGPSSHVTAACRTCSPRHRPPGHQLALLVHFQDEIAHPGGEGARAAPHVGGLAGFGSRGRGGLRTGCRRCAENRASSSTSRSRGSPCVGCLRAAHPAKFSAAGRWCRVGRALPCTGRASPRAPHWRGPAGNAGTARHRAGTRRTDPGARRGLPGAQLEASGSDVGRLHLE